MQQEKWKNENNKKNKSPTICICYSILELPGLFSPPPHPLISCKQRTSLTMTLIPLSSDRQLVLCAFVLLCSGKSGNRGGRHAHSSSGWAAWCCHCLFRGKHKQIDWAAILQLLMLTHPLHYQWGRDAGQEERGMLIKWSQLSPCLLSSLSLCPFFFCSPSWHPTQGKVERVIVVKEKQVTVHLKLFYETSVDIWRALIGALSVYKPDSAWGLIPSEGSLLRRLRWLAGWLKGGRGGEGWGTAADVSRQHWGRMHHFSIPKWAQCHRDRAALLWGHRGPAGEMMDESPSSLSCIMTQVQHAKTNSHSKPEKYICIPYNAFSHRHLVHTCCLFSCAHLSKYRQQISSQNHLGIHTSTQAHKHTLWVLFFFFFLCPHEL